MNSNSEVFSTQETDLKTLLGTYTKHWKWFVLSVIFTLALAYFYARYATPEFAAKAKIQIIEDKNAASELSALQDLDILGGTKSKVEDEIEILNSRSNFLNVVKELELNVKTTMLGNVKDSEVYTNKPFKINFAKSSKFINKSKFSFYIEVSSKTTFGYSVEIDDPVKVYTYGKNLPTPTY